MTTNEEDSDYASPTQAKHQCRECGKSFFSHQALGGHLTTERPRAASLATLNKVSSRKNTVLRRAKERRLVELMMGCFEPLSFDGKGQKMDVGRVVISSSRKRKPSSHHECSICKKLFPTGQALGGHKRCHWEKRNGTTKATNNSPFSLI